MPAGEMGCYAEGDTGAGDGVEGAEGGGNCRGRVSNDARVHGYCSHSFKRAGSGQLSTGLRPAGRTSYSLPRLTNGTNGGSIGEPVSLMYALCGLPLATVCIY